MTPTTVPSGRASRLLPIAFGAVVLVALVALPGCGGAQQTPDRRVADGPESVTPALTDELNTALARYYRRTTLPIDIVGASRHRFRRALRRKADHLRSLRRRLAEIAGRGRRRESRDAIYRIAELYLNFGCEVARLQAPGGAEDRQSIRERLARKSGTLLREAMSEYRRLEAVEGYEHSRRVERVLAAWRSSSGAPSTDRVRTVCADTRSIWRKRTVELGGDRSGVRNRASREAAFASVRRFRRFVFVDSSDSNP